MTVKELYEKVCNDNADFLCYLWGRWQDEKEYEDIQNYLKAIQKSIPEAFRITKRPFGIICKCDDGNIYIQIKRKGNGLEIVGKGIVTTEKYFAFVVTEDNRAKVGYTGAEGENLVIPATFQDTDGTWYKVVGIGDNAFNKCAKLASVVIPDSVTSIGSHAFYGCMGLTSVTIPDSVTSIGSHAFAWCRGLKDVCYAGSEEQWETIAIRGHNKYLVQANITYNYTTDN